MRYEDIHFLPESELKTPMGELKKRNLDAVRTLDDEESAKLWDYICANFEEAARWASIPEEEPDEFDLEMLEEIKNDPDCHIFAPAEEVEAYLMGLPDGEETA